MLVLVLVIVLVLVSVAWKRSGLSPSRVRFGNVSLYILLEEREEGLEEIRC